MNSESANQNVTARGLTPKIVILWLTSLAAVSIVTTRVNSCIAQQRNDVPTAVELVHSGDWWEYVTARRYLDGGTWDLGFQERNGYLIYIRIDYRLGVDHQYRRFHIGNSIVPNRGDFVEIARGSELEEKVIDLIENSRDHNAEKCNILPAKATVVALLKSRDIRIKLGEPAP